MRIRLSRRVHHQHVASLETLDSMDGSDAIRSVTGTLLPEFLGEPDENSFGASDIAEPIRVLIPDHFADELRAAFDEPGQRVVDVAYGEHHAQVTESVHWSAAVISDQGFDFVYIPNVMLVPPCDAVRHALERKAIQRFTSLWIALISQLSVTVDGMVTAPPQFVAD